MKIKILLFALLVLFTLTHAEAKSSITKAPYGKTADGTQIDIYTLTNSKGMEVKIINYGGIIVSLKVPDRKGKFEDVVLGYDSLASYLTDAPYIGALIGRYGNRIAKGRFTLNGKEYVLAQNNGENHLHGGIVGYNKVVWTVGKTFVDKAGAHMELTYLSKDGEEGYPGNLSIKV